MSGQNVSLRRMSDVQKISLYSLCIPTVSASGAEVRSNRRMGSWRRRRTKTKTNKQKTLDMRIPEWGGRESVSWETIRK